MSTGTQELVIDIPQNEWLTSNQRLHPMAKAARTKALRRRAWGLSRANLHPVTGPVLVVAESHYRTGRGLDADACAPSVKACLDGMTDAGIWEDDSGKYVGGILYKASRRDKTLCTGWHAISLVIVEQEVSW